VDEGSAEPVKLLYDQGVARLQRLQRPSETEPISSAPADTLVGEDALASGRLQRVALQRARWRMYG